MTQQQQQQQQPPNISIVHLI